MADRYLLESGAPDGYLLEDGSGVLLLESADVTLALAGLEIPTAAGVLTNEATEVLTGTALACQSGTLKADWHLESQTGQAGVLSELPPVGEVVTSAAGDLDNRSDVPVVGAECVSAIESLSASFDSPLTGEDSLSADGSVTELSSDVPLTGADTSVADGTLTALTDEKHAALTGEAMTAEQSVFGTMGGTYVVGVGGDVPRRCRVRPVGTLVRQYLGPRRRR